MKLSRRNFLKLSGVGTSTLLLPWEKGRRLLPLERFPLHKRIGEGHTVCPYCSVGCGLLVATDEEGHITNSEGDPDHIINRGALDPKSVCVRQLSTSPRRIGTVKYRAPGSNKFVDKDWDWAIKEIAKRIKDTRDATFESKDASGVTVNRTKAIAWLGGAANNDEDCYLAVKLMRSLGLIFIEHQARICHSSTVGALIPSFGRGAMTNHWIDMKNSDCIWVMGSNAAECHPASMLWINKARFQRGAKLIVCDPRFTRTAATADIYAPFRSGTDIAFLGGVINYILGNKLYHHEYVAHFTNAATLINPGYKGPVELNGLFSGYDPAERSYDQSSWTYQLDDEGNPKRDLTLQDPNCVFQIMKRHYARYTPEMVGQICGTPEDKFLEVARTFAETGQPGKSGTYLYAMGQTQHTTGVQNIRAIAMLQLLLGNIGVPGGGVNALRGESNVQGSTDMAVLFHIMPGYMATPHAAKHPTLKDYLEKETPKTSYWNNKPKFTISQLKAWWGDYATKDNDFCYDYLGKIDGDHSHISLFEAMYAGVIKGMLVMGQNPAVSGPNVRFERKAMEKLEWLVVMELFDTETASFWKGPEADPKSINTEVFLLPAADATEKAGSIVTSGRLIQWRPKVSEPPREAKPDIWILDQIYRGARQAYAGSTDPRDKPILELNWDYGPEPDVELIAKEINGYWTRDTEEGSAGEVIPLFTKLKDDGSTACGNWLYSGYFYPMDDGTGTVMPASKRRGQRDPGGIGTYPYWAYVWPANRHIIYNRASADTKGRPWSEEKALIWWDANRKRWVGYDVPDFAATKAPDAPGGDSPFIMKTDGKGWLFAPRKDGPLPEHYEPLESPITNPLSKQQNNPAIVLWDTDRGKDIGDNVGTPDEYPIVATTFRLVEHWQSGAMSRNLSWLAEAQPDMFIEISKELAREKGIKNGEKVIVSSARGEIEAVAMVTARFKPYQLGDKRVHHVGMPWHYGWQGIATGHSANVLTPHVGDANTMIPEYKAFLVDIRKAGK